MLCFSRLKKVTKDHLAVQDSAMEEPHIAKRRKTQCSKQTIMLDELCIKTWPSSSRAENRVRYLNFSSLLFYCFPVCSFFPHRLSSLSAEVFGILFESGQWVPVPVCYWAPQNYGKLHRKTVLLHFTWVINCLKCIWTSFKLQNYLRWW